VKLVCLISGGVLILEKKMNCRSSFGLGECTCAKCCLPCTVAGLLDSNGVL
jgi:hypothetical protein